MTSSSGSDLTKKLTDLEHRSVIKFLTKEGKKPKEIHERLVAVYGEDAPSSYKVKFWSKQFKWGRESIEDDPHTGRPVEASSPEVCKKVEDLIMADRRVKIARIAEEMGIAIGTVHKIIHEKLWMTKVSARWVPRMLTPLQKDVRRQCSKENLELLHMDPDDFYQRLVTGDETWVYHKDPESKMESMQWKHRTSPTPKKFRVEKSAGKVMATVFWDKDGLLLLEFMPRKSTINGEVYANTLAVLREKIKEKRRGKLTSGVLLLHDNAPVHASRKAQAAIRACDFKQLDHPPYSPDLAPSDYYLFRHLKKFLRGQRFSSDEEVKAVVETWFAEQPKEFFCKGITSLEGKWSKCVELLGDYVEK